MRKILGAAAAAGLLALAATGCSTAVAGTGTFAGGPLSTDGPTASPTGGPTEDPTGSPTESPESPGESPSEDPSESPSGGPAGSDQQAIAGVAERWYHALAEKDGDTVCGLMTESAQRQTGSDCEQAVQETTFSTSQREAMRQIEVDAGQIQVSGDGARIPASAFSVNGQQSSSSGRLAAARSGSEWLIDGVG